MKIKGIQELTLIDYPGKIACTLFLFGCNFQCGFCHNPELVLSPVGKDYSEKEILGFLEKRKGQLDGVCITGGEPLLTIKPEFLKAIKDLGYSIKIDTNGSFPEMLEELIKDGLVDYVAMDVKASKDNYKDVSCSDVDIRKIEKSMKVISTLLDYYEFRTTILEDLHDVKEMEELAKWVGKVTAGKPKKFVLQGFKNQGKFIDDSFKKKADTTKQYLNELKDILEEYFDEIEIRH